MTDQELRALVRQAVERHLRPQPGVRGPQSVTKHSDSGPSIHPSHAVYLSIVNTTDACVIEPGVACNHCNYCRSHGH